MNLKSSILCLILLATTQFCFAQEASASKELKPIKFELPVAPSPLYVLKAGDKTVEIDAERNEALDFESLDKHYVQSIQVLQGVDAKERYGERAANGAVVILFKDSYILSKEAVMKLEWVK
jgi:hypothetical protein